VVFGAIDPDNIVAQEELARIYWYPLYAFARSRGLQAEEAADLVQSFLSRLLTAGSLRGLTREGGRFRDFLRVGLQNQLVSAHRAAAGRRRRPQGGFLLRDGLDPEVALALEPTDRRTPEAIYDRCCVRALLDATLDRLRAEYKRAGNADLFAHLAGYLDGDPDEATHRATAGRLGLAEGSVRNAMKKFRTRFQRLFRQQVAATLEDPSQVEAEIRHLLAALST